MEIDQIDNASPVVRGRNYTVINQRVDLDISFDQRIRGTTHLTIFPENPNITGISLNARQCEITKVTVNGLKSDRVDYADPCDTLALHTDSTVRQHHHVQQKIDGALTSPPEPELVILLPSDLEIKENHEFVTQTADGVKALKSTGILSTETETVEALADTAVSRYTRLEVEISFVSIHTRDILQFSCGPPGSGKWPHVYTRGGFLPGRTSTLFPCVDSLYYRCTWELSITGPRTVGDALRQITGDPEEDRTADGAQAYEAKEMVFVCPGEITDDVISKNDPSKRTVSYSISQNVSPQHIGFAIGPFEKLDLGTLREANRIEMLGENATPITAYCLPGRLKEVENTCLPTTDALDHFALTHAPFPFASFSYCFVDDQIDRPASFAGLAVCSTHMLYPETVIDPAQEITRSLVQALTTQWLGIQIIPARAEDTWVVLGSAIFLAELYMKELCGNNEYRYRMKTQSDRICKLDNERPSLWDMGALLHVDPEEYEFIALKAPVVLFILDRRIAKTIGSPKMNISIGKFMSRARNDDLKDNALSTQDFCKMMEKVLHSNIDDFINQWVRGAGCPSFSATQRFNKKKLVIEMTIRQTQNDRNPLAKTLDTNNFMRDVREEHHEVYAATAQPAFSGPMTIRIHEADGTPYEHIIQIRDTTTKVEVPYNTKYKRLKRSKKQRAKNLARAENDEEQEALVYCLGDVLQDEEEVNNWRITEWSKEDEDRMNSESYEWIRLDADFEWIAEMRIGQPGYMWVSQLQQDRDVDAQLLSIQSIGMYTATPLISSIFLRTMMDARYFHGIRTAAAAVLAKQASPKEPSNMIGLFHLKKAYEELYCTREGTSVMTKPNDFSDQLSYYLQCALVKSLSRVREDEDGKYTPHEVKAFLLDKLKYNDNSANEFSDAHYVSTLLKGLTEALIARRDRPADEDLDEMSTDEHTYWANQIHFEQQCLDEIDRYRRMDEWTSSYQNLYSRTALECQAMLSRAGITRFSIMHFLQYARPGNYDLLRCDAYDVLATPELFADSRVLQYFVHGMMTSGSPYVRARMRQAFGRALARRAIGQGQDKSVLTIEKASSDGLTVEGQPVSAVEIPDEARRTTIEGALKALKRELGDDNTLQRALWEALTHPHAGYEDVNAMVDFCQMLYEQKDEAHVRIPLPRYWKMEIIGKGKVAFKRGESFRRRPLDPAPQVLRYQESLKTKEIIPLKISTRPYAEKTAASKIPLKLKVGGSRKDSLISAGRSPSVSVATPSPPPQPQRTKSTSTATLSTSASTAASTSATVAVPVPKLKLKFTARPSLGQ